MLRFRSRVLCFRVLGASFSRIGCFVLRSSFSSASFSKLPETTQGPEEMCLSLEHQNPSKTSEKMGYFDRVTVSLHILCAANQETEGSQDRLTVTRHFMPRSPFGRRAVRHRGYGLRLLIFKMANNKVDLGQIRSEGIVYSIYTTPQALSFKPYRV